jgi:poly-gamma-glutamate synthesis protein (capsule biosynthesis protein)
MGRVAALFDKEDYSSVLQEVIQLTNSVDYAIVNYECPIAGEEEKPIKKQGPNLKSSVKGADAISYAGFDCVTLANNHFLDYGVQGVRNTLNAFKALNIDCVGGGVNLSEAEKTLFKEIGGKSLAIINCCEHEFSIATESTAGSNPLNPIHQYNAIQDARGKADCVLVIVHGGHEHFQLPSPRMVDTYRFFIDAGADAVVNHHQHCYSGYEVYNGKPIFYGLGNFCFDSLGIATKEWTEGYVAVIEFEKNKIHFELHPYCQCAEEPRVKLLNMNSFDVRLKELNGIIKNGHILKEHINQYYESCADECSRVLVPCDNRFYWGARHRGWIPSLISAKRIVYAENYIDCESHRDKLIHWLHSM